MAKKVTGYINLQVPACQANPSPPVGPALGQRGVNIMEFVKAFNAKTEKDVKDGAITAGTPIPVVITVYADRSFTFITKKPPASVLIRLALNLPKGSGTPNLSKVGRLTQAQLEKIAQTKMEDLNATDITAAKRIIAGTARSMGVDVEGAENG